MVILKDGSTYFGRIEYLDDYSIEGEALITLVDKDFKSVNIWESEIEFIKEVDKDGKKKD